MHVGHEYSCGCRICHWHHTRRYPPFDPPQCAEHKRACEPEWICPECLSREASNESEARVADLERQLDTKARETAALREALQAAENVLADCDYGEEPALREVREQILRALAPAPAHTEASHD